jgi:hypothetical protein
MEVVVTPDDISYLRFYVAQLVRIWAALRIIRGKKAGELIHVFQDLCSDKLRNMLHELANKKSWTLAFSATGTAREKRLFAKLAKANRWFEGYQNRLHSRNLSGAHLQSLDKADHTFQIFGYHGEREWKQLTKGVAACVALMKLIDNDRNTSFWRNIRLRVSGQIDESVLVNIEGKEIKLDVPIGVKAILQSFRVEE